MTLNKALTFTTTAIVVVTFSATLVLSGCGQSSTKSSTKGTTAEQLPKVSAAEAKQAKQKGLDLYRQGDWDGAQAQLQRAVGGNPKDVNARYQLAYTYEQKGKLDNAFQQYEEILKVDKGSADAHYSVGRILVQKKQLDKAITEFETAAKLNPNFTSARADLAVAYTQKKQFDKALATYDELAKLTKTDNFYQSRIHLAKGKIYKEMGKGSNATAEFNKALELDKNNAEAKAALSK